MLDVPGITVVSEATRKARQQAPAIGYFPQQQHAAVGTDAPAVKTGHHLMPTKTLEFKLTCLTLCLHRPAPPVIKFYLLPVGYFSRT